MRNLLNERGRVGCLLPTGIATDDTPKRFFQDVVNTKSLASLFDFENKGIFFPDVHRNYKFCLFTAGRGLRPTADQAEFVFFAHGVEALRDPERQFALSPEDIALLNPNTCTCPIFRSSQDAELAKAIYRRVPVLIREVGDGQNESNPWDIRFKQGLFNMTADSDLFHTRKRLEADGWILTGNVFRNDGAERLPLYEAKMIHQFDHRWASYREAGGREAAVDVTRQEKEDSGFTVLPRYWVEAREVHLRSANLPKGLLTALRDRNADLVVLAVCHLLFIDSLRRDSEGSADAATARAYPAWIEFVERSPPLVPSHRPKWACAEATRHAFNRSVRTIFPRNRSTRSSPIRARAPLGLPSIPEPCCDRSPLSSSTAISWILPRPCEPRKRCSRLRRSCCPCRLPLADGLARHHPERGEADDNRRHHPVCGSRAPISAHVPDTTARRVAGLLGILNSFAFDFVVRQKISGIHIPFFTMNQIAAPPPDAFSETDIEFLVPRVLELLYTGEDLRDFALDCGWDSPPFRWDEDRRFLLRCELDAAFFHLYLPAEANGDWRSAHRSDGYPCDETPEQFADLKHHFPTPRDAVAYILDTFPQCPPRGRSHPRRIPNQAHHPRDLRRNAGIHRHRRALPEPASIHHPPTRAVAMHPVRLHLPHCYRPTSPSSGWCVVPAWNRSGWR